MCIKDVNNKSCFPLRVLPLFGMQGTVGAQQLFFLAHLSPHVLLSTEKYLSREKERFFIFYCEY